MRIRNKPLILGCGNIFRGDDGFGPKVVEYIIKEHLVSEEEVKVLDVGLGISQVLLNILSEEEKPTKLILVDALQQKGTIGEVKVLGVQDVPDHRSVSPSHTFPNRDMLAQLEAMGVKIYIVACIVGYLPNEVCTEMSNEVVESIPKAAALAARLALDP
ncbi:MAG: hydrogenase maturation protease [Nitrososphaerales archaeon]